MNRMQRVVTALMTLGLALPLCAETFTPDFRVKPGDISAFLGVDSRYSGGLRPFQAGGHGKFYLVGWQRADQQADWTLQVDEAGDYEAEVLVRRVSGGAPAIRLEAAGTNLTGRVRAEEPGWHRARMEGRIALPAGKVGVALRFEPDPAGRDFGVEVHAIELSRAGVRDELLRRAVAERADTGWFQRARYGIMVHWTSESMPRHGDRRPYADAVDAFDAEGFAERMAQTGAGFVVFTTSHAEQVFPAPLAALDAVLPGRTTRRDLVADLAAALERRGLKLMLYHHLGTTRDPEWLRASGFWESDTTRFFQNWRAIIGEAGARYGERLAGWWFDDGSVTFYAHGAPWEELARAARAGNPNRLIGFNPWELNSPTMFQDLYLGEGNHEPAGCGLRLRRGGDGRYPDGPHAGLQGSACLVAGGTWVHTRRDAEPAGVDWTAEALAARIRAFMEHRNVPIFNLEITQDGWIAPQALETFRAAAALLPRE